MKLPEVEEEQPKAKVNPKTDSEAMTKVSRTITQTVDDKSERKKSSSPEPPQNPPARVLQVLNLVRPFTLNQLKGMLSREGNIASENGFWIDKIKSKCIVKVREMQLPF